MKLLSTSGFLIFIVASTLAVEAVLLGTGQAPGRAIFRVLLLVILVALVLKGKNFARLTLSVLYALGGLTCLVGLVGAWHSAATLLMGALLSYSGFLFASSAFLWKSPVLRAMTTKRKSKTVDAV